jgi:hypothetical protein
MYGQQNIKKIHAVLVFRFKLYLGEIDEAVRVTLKRV